MHDRLLIVLSAAVLLAGCASLDLDRRHTASPVWTTEGETALRDNAVPQRLAPPLEERWDFNAGAGFGSVSPLIIGDAVLVATRKGEVHAIDIETGGRLGNASFGESIEGTPVYVDGTLVVPVAWGGIALHAHDLIAGNRRWRVRGVPVSSGLAVHDGKVIAGDVEGYVRAYGLDDGEEIWERQLDERSGVYSSPVVVDDLVVVANDRGQIAALNGADGSLVWSASAGAPVQVSLAANEETVFASTTRGRISAFDVATGARKWEHALSSSAAYVASPAVGEWEVVFGSSDGVVRALDVESGSELWSTDVAAAVTAPPVITDDMVYVGTMRSKLMALARGDGSVAWETELDGRMKSAFAVKGSYLIVLAEPRLVYQFSPSVESYAVQSESATSD